jgi:serine/threonine protein phosphatase PrpC
MRAIAAGVTDVGMERDHNEDRFVLLPEFEVFVVADGMGGHQCGEVASQMATSTIATYFRDRRGGQDDGSISDILHASLLSANERIHHRAMNSTAHRGMGTTVVAAAFHAEEEKLYVAHAGDSRCYRLRNQVFEQVTRDHSLVEEALRTRPDITESELSYLPSNVITRALGVEPTVDVEIAIERVEARDVYLLCSDGLSGFVSDERIGEILREVDVLTNACVALVAEANGNGGGDNVTAVLVRIEELALPLALTSSVPAPPSPRTAAALLANEVSIPAANWPSIVDEDTIDSDSFDIGEHDDTVDGEDGVSAGLSAGVIVNVAAATPDVVATIAESDDQEAARALIEVEDTGRLPAITDAEAILAAKAEGLDVAEPAEGEADEDVDE